jgi:hypothetical protein
VTHLGRVRRRWVFVFIDERRARWERFCALGLLAAVVALMPLAHARPPDPVWLPGIYDDADFDDVALAAMFCDGAVERPLPAGERPALVIARSAPRPEEIFVPRAFRSSLNVRAPPQR